jgi:hypothetical protein
MTDIKKSAMNHLRRLQLRDTLMNCSKDVIQNDEKKLTYAKGVLAGVVGAIMTIAGTSFEETVEFTKQLLPEDFDERCIPQWKDWQDAFIQK